MYYVHRYLKFATFWTNTYPWCASSRAAVVAACYLIPQKNGCANILRQKTLTLVNFTTQFSYFPGCSGYLVCCMTPEFVCVMIGSKKEIGTTLIDFLSNLVRCVYTWELTLAQFQIWYYFFIHFKNYECILIWRFWRTELNQLFERFLRN